MADQLSLELELGPAVRRLSPEQRAALEEHLRLRPPDDADWQERYRWWLRLIDLRRAQGAATPGQVRPKYLERRRRRTEDAAHNA